MSKLSRAAGRRRRRRDDGARERGAARHRPRALHRRPGRPQPGRAARPPGPGAARPRARSPASTRARRTTSPGVVRVLTEADVPGINDAGIKHDEPLFPDEVMYYGHAVCWVLGETLEAARRGALAGRGRLRAAARDHDRGRGDRGRQLPGRAAGAASAATRRPGSPRAAQVFEGEIEFAGQEHFYLETHCSLATVDEDGQVFVQSSTQHPTETQEIVAHVLGVPSHRVTVQCLRMGGGFGGKEMQPHGLAAIAALGATLTGRPVRLRLTAPAGHDDDRQAARLPRVVAGRLRRRRAASWRSRRR